MLGACLLSAMCWWTGTVLFFDMLGILNIVAIIDSQIDGCMLLLAKDLVEI